jgi:hypothetical protein
VIELVTELKPELVWPGLEPEPALGTENGFECEVVGPEPVGLGSVVGFGLEPMLLRRWEPRLEMLWGCEVGVEFLLSRWITLYLIISQTLYNISAEHFHSLNLFYILRISISRYENAL